MKYDEFRRSDNVEDYTDPSKPVPQKIEVHETIRERLALVNSELAKDAGSNDIKGK